MGYLTNSGTGFLKDALTTVSNVKSYLVNKTGYLVDAIRVGIGDFGQRVLDDGGTVEASAEAAASYREITKDIYDQASLVLFPSGYKDNLLYSHKPVNGSGDFTYTRGTDTATRVGADGYIKKERANLLEQSNQFDTTWVINTSVSEGEEGYDGTTDAWSLTRAVGGALMGYQTVSLSGVSTYSIYAKINTNNGIGLALGGLSIAARFDLRDATKTQAVTETGIISSSQKYVGNGFYRLSITANVSGSTQARIYLTTADATTSDSNGGTHIIQDSQIEEGLVATPYIETTTAPVYEGLTDNLPRIDYTGGTPSILLEPSRTNQCSQSEYIGSSDWAGNGNTRDIIVTQTSEINPEGSAICWKIQGTSFDNQLANNSSTTSGTTITNSVYVKRVSGTGNVILRDVNNSQTSFSLSVADGWKRIDVTGTATSETARFYLNLVDYTDEILVWGAQQEQGSYPTSYIPTYNASATRAADLGSLLTLPETLSTNYTIFGETTRLSPNDETDDNIIELTGTASSKFRLIANQNSYTRFRFYPSDGGASVSVYETLGEWSQGSTIKWALVYQSGSIEVFANGSPIGTTSANMEFTSLFLRTPSKLKKILLFTEALSDDDCKALTAL